MAQPNIRTLSKDQLTQLHRAYRHRVKMWERAAAASFTVAIVSVLLAVVTTLLSGLIAAVAVASVVFFFFAAYRMGMNWRSADEVRNELNERSSRT